MTYAIHPVAGRMPGHMNVLLAEANVPYPALKEMDDANAEFPRTDVSLVIGANDVVNPDARNNASSPIYGMPILNVDASNATIVLKRSMNPGFAGIENPLFVDPKTLMLFGDAKESVARARRRRQAAVTKIPVFTRAHVEQAVPPAVALDAVREAFVAHARGEWTMPAKVYVTNYPAGDFRAMPALGGGHALLKWVTSFPGNPARNLPTVTGLVLLSNAETGQLEAILDAAAVTALRTGAAAVLAAETLGRPDARTAAVVGAGVNGSGCRRDVRRARSSGLALGSRRRARRGGRRVARCVGRRVPRGGTGRRPARDGHAGHEVLLGEGLSAPGQHVSLMGADGPGKAEIAPSELARTRLFCDDWEQASHGGELAAVFAAGLVSRDDVTQLGDVLAGSAQGRTSAEEITTFDSTGLAIQDLAIALAALARAGELELPVVDL